MGVFNVVSLHQSEKKAPAAAAAAAPKKVSRTVELLVDTRSHAPDAQQLNALLENESKMAAADRLETDRLDAKVRVGGYSIVAYP